MIMINAVTIYFFVCVLGGGKKCLSFTSEKTKRIKTEIVEREKKKNVGAVSVWMS